MDDIEADVAAFEAHLASEQPLVVQPEPPVAVVEQGPVNMLSVIMQLARDSSVDVTKLSALLSMQERMEARDAEKQFNAGLARIQAKAPRIPKNGIVKLGEKNGREQSYNFANWEDMDTIVSPLLREEGFTVTFSEEASDQNGIRWAATWRAFGHSEKNLITLPADTGAGRNPLQARGSTNSYAKRYLTEDFLKLVREGTDDDGKRGGTIYVRPEQAVQMRELCSAAERNEDRFLEQYTTEAQSFEEVIEGDFGRLMRLLTSAKHMVDQRKAKAAARENTN